MCTEALLHTLYFLFYTPVMIPVMIPVMFPVFSRVQLPHPAVQCRQPARLRAAVSRHQRVRQSPAAPEDRRRHESLELAARPAGR